MSCEMFYKVLWKKFYVQARLKLIIFTLHLAVKLRSKIFDIYQSELCTAGSRENNSNLYFLACQ